MAIPFVIQYNTIPSMENNTFMDSLALSTILLDDEERSLTADQMTTFTTTC